jgi:hypothetical protein|tara:strand:- start:185 stop:568 length:384 start_codon:yes stop_codon:yes gene_type:complete
MAKQTEQNSYPQKYFLVPEACRHFGLKLRTFKSWRETGIEIPGLMKVKGSNYYVIDPIPFHTWLIETRLEPATQNNKLHNRTPKNIPLRKEGNNQSREKVSGVDNGFNSFPSTDTRRPKPNIPGLTL